MLVQSLAAYLGAATRTKPAQSYPNHIVYFKCISLASIQVGLAIWYELRIDGRDAQNLNQQRYFLCILDILSMSWPSSEPNLITHSRLKPWICWHIHALINDLLVKKWFVFQLFTVVQRKISLSFYVCSLQWFQVRFTFETNGLVIDGPWILVKKRLQIHICQTIN